MAGPLQEAVTSRLRSHDRLWNPSSGSSALVSRQASVLVPLALRPRASNEPRGPTQLEENARIWVLLTVRASTLSSHAGEVALPGAGDGTQGRRDPTDADDVAVALREADEEIGLPASEVLVAGEVDQGALPARSPPQFISKHGLLVTPVVAWIPATFAPAASAAEVAAVFWAPLDVFLDAEGHSAHDMVWGGLEQRMHTFAYGGHRIWGLTASILIHVAGIALGREPAFETHVAGQLTPMAMAAMYNGVLELDRGGHL